MKLWCARCGQRIKKEAGRIASGPVGPVCAERLGLPRVIPQVLRKDGMPRAEFDAALDAAIASIYAASLT